MARDTIRESCWNRSAARRACGRRDDSTLSPSEHLETVTMTGRRRMTGSVLIAMLLPAALAGYQNSGNDGPDRISSLIGVWKGQSLCAAKGTACHDETVVYRIARLPAKPGHV